MGKERETNRRYPQLVSTAPCNDDWFKGQSHKRIANKIADVILDNSQHGIIGIDGGWGSGKSNLVGMTQKLIAERTKDDKKYVFVTFDVWAHHTDYQRRSLLEEFIKSLMDEKVLDDTWLEAIDMLLAKVREIDTKRIVKLNEMVIATSILAAIMPIIHTISDHWEYGYYIAIFAYLSVLLWFFMSRYKSMKRFRQKISLYNFASECLKLYVDKSNIESKQGYSEVNNKNSENKTVEFITEKEPTARQFRDWMHRIDEELRSKKTHVVFVIDNMDRLPIAKVKETWATIHAFFAECKYNYIHTVIPFDRSHIVNAFKEENIRSKQIAGNANGSADGNREIGNQEIRSYGNDFINKTFHVVYRVPLPILSDWREYFDQIWKTAFGDDLYENHDSVLLVFEKLSPDFTPRSIISFVNECVTLWSVLEEEIPADYLGLYVLGKERIEENPDKELLNPSFLEGLTAKYSKNETLPEYLSAIHYQIKKEEALDVVYSPKVEKAIDNGNLNFIEQMGNDRVLNSLLPNAIGKVKDIDKAIEFMAAISQRENAATYFSLDYLWDMLFERIQEVDYTILNYDKHHAILLDHCTKKKAVVRYFMENYLQMAKDWNVKDYVDGVKRFRELASKETNEFLAANHVIAKDEVIEELLLLEKEHYFEYGLMMDSVSFDKYLAKKEAVDFEKVDYFPIIFSDQCKLENTWKRLIELAEKSSVVEEHITILKRLKDINGNNSLRADSPKAYSDQKIHSLFIDCSKGDELYADLIAMRIARGKNFNPGIGNWQMAYLETMKEQDEAFAQEVADVLLLYVDYERFMLSLKDFNEKILVGSIARFLTQNETKIEKEIPTKSLMLLHFEEIINASGLTAADLLGQIQRSAGPIDYQGLADWPINLFRACREINLDVANEINRQVESYLRNIATEQWQKQLSKAGFDLQLWTIYKPSLMNLKDAAINLLISYSTSGTPKPDKQTLMNILKEFGGEKYNLKDNFIEIYDNVVKKGIKDLVIYFTSWFFELGIIDSEARVSALYKTTLLDDANVVTELVKIGDYLRRIKLPADFIEKLAQMAIGNRKNEEAFVTMCKTNEQINAAIERILDPKENRND